jgi:hypothetical protein
MDCIALIPWTPRTERHPATPEATAEAGLCERTIANLQPIILAAIKPFPEAHRAMSLALMQFAVPKAVT